MSLDATRYAWKNKNVKGNAKFILVALADRADENHQCWPSVDRLREDTGLDRKTIHACLNLLETKKIIVRIGSKNRCNLYKIIGISNREDESTYTNIGTSELSTIKTSCAEIGTGTYTEIGTSGAEPETTSCTNIGTSSCTDIGIQTYQLTDQLLIKKESKKKKELNQWFIDIFWPVVVNKVGRKKTKAAFDKVAIDEPFVKMMAAKYVDLVDWRVQMGRLGAFAPELPHPATWVNQHRWEDELTTPSLAPKSNQFAKGGNLVSVASPGLPPWCNGCRRVRARYGELTCDACLRAKALIDEKKLGGKNAEVVS